MQKSFTALVVLVLAACGGSPANSAPAQGRHETCEERVERVRARLATIHMPEWWTHKPRGLDVPQSQRGVRVSASAPTLAIFRDGRLEIDQTPIAGQAELTAALERLRRSYSLLHPGEAYQGRLLVWADSALTLSDVRRHTQGAADHELVLLAVDQTWEHADHSACPSSLDCNLMTGRTGTGDDRTAVVLDRWEAAVTTCSGMQALTSAVREAELEEKVTTLQSGLPDAIAACNCHLDVEEIEFITMSIIDPFIPTSSATVALGVPMPGSDVDGATTVGAFR